MRSIYKQILAVAVALIFSLALFLGIRVTMIPDVQKTVLSEVSIPISSGTLPVVLLDAGHGGVDGGRRGL